MKKKVARRKIAMKRFLIITLLIVSQFIYGMPSSDRADISFDRDSATMKPLIKSNEEKEGVRTDVLSDQENSPTIKALVPYSEIRYTANEEVTVEKDAVKIEFQLQDAKEIPVVKELVLYDSCHESGYGYLKNIDMNGFEEQPKEPYITILLCRHLRTPSNVSGVSHKNGASCEITPDIILDNAASLAFMKKVLMFDGITGGDFERYILSAKFISSDGQPEYVPMKEFNEQDIGYFKGKSIKEILGNPNYIESWHNPDYKIEGATETVKEATERFKRGLNYWTNKLMKSGNTEPKLLCIFSSRCLINCGLRYCTNDMTLPLQLNIPNCHAFCANYYPNTDTFQFLRDQNGMPCCISPTEIVALAFKSPVFTPFLEEFYQEVSKVIQKKDEINIEKIASATISRSNSFSDKISVNGRRRTFSEETTNSNKSDHSEKKSISRSSSFYIENEPLSRSNSRNSFQNKKSLTH